VNILSLAHKNLDKLYGYVDIEHGQHNFSYDLLSNLQLDEGESIIGLYDNHLICDNNLVVITNYGIKIQNKDIFDDVKYENIQNCDTTSSKYTDTISICQKDGICKSILVSGVKEDKFLDIYGFLRFVRKVIINTRLCEK
jgi:hypothetical protein